MSNNIPPEEYQFTGAGLFMAAQNNDIAKVASDIKMGANINGQMQDGLTPLFMAVANGHVDMATLLLDAGASPDLGLKETNATPIMLAAQHGKMDMIKLLLAKGANINCVMTNGITPLFLAVQGPNLETAHVFLDAGADVNCVMDSTGATPLIVCALKDKREAVDLLLSKGADKSMKLKGGASLFKCCEELLIQDKMAEVMAQASMEGKLKQGGNDWTAEAIADLFGHNEIAEKIKAHK